MTRLVILVKSHRPDLPYVERLIDSFVRHNVDAIPLHLVVPDSDLDAFAPLVADGVVLHGEAILARHLVTEPVGGLSAGYVNQEIVKLAFWETGLAANYFCADSELEFVRDFARRDFMADDDTPYTLLTEDAALQSEPEYFATHWPIREASLRRIMDEVGLHQERMLTVHGHAIFSAGVLRDLRDRLLQPRGWGYADLVAVAPYEPSWYNFWLQSNRTIPIVMREPIVKTIHNSTQYLEYSLCRVSTTDVARGFVAVVVNSNYSRGLGVVSLDEPRPAMVATYVPIGELLRAFGRRMWRAITRRS